MLNTFSPLSPDGTGAVSDRKASPSAEQVRGARLLRSFLNRRRLGLLKTAACYPSSDNILFLGGSETTLKATERSMPALGTVVRHKIARSTSEDGTHRPPAVVDADSAAPADAAFAGASILGTPLKGIPQFFDRAVDDAASPAGQSCSQFLCNTAVSAENLRENAEPIKHESLVEVVVRPRSSLQSQCVPAGAAADFSASASARDGGTATHGGEVPGQGSGCLDLCGTKDGKVDFDTGSDAMRGAIRNKASTLPAKLWDQDAVTGKRGSSRLTKSPLSIERSGSLESLSIEIKKRSTTDGYQRHLEEYGETESSSASYSAESSKNLQLSREMQNMERPRPSHVAEGETFTDIEERSIFVEQQRAAVAIAQATAAVLRRKVRMLQAENERLVYRWGHRQTQTQEHGNSKRCFCSADVCGCKNHFLRFCRNYAEPAGADTTGVCENFSATHDEIQILKQQLAICRREVHMLSQENDHLRSLRSRET